MKYEFELTVRRRSTTEPPSIEMALSKGVSLGSAPDGTVAIAVLGATGRDDLASRIAADYVKRGRDPLACAQSDSGVVVVDRQLATTLVVAPPIGMRQIFWRSHGNTLKLASTPRLLALQDLSLSIRPESILRYVYFHMIPGPDSVYRGVAKLDGGHQLVWNGGEADVTRYWRPRFVDDTPISEREAAEELLQVLRLSVDESMEPSSAVGAFLSGGLDSSTIAGLAAQSRPGIPSVTMGFDVAGYDEMSFARLASRHFGTTPLEYYVTPEDVLGTLPMIVGAFAEPFGNSSAAAAFHCARIAREHGLDLLLAGDGGDELFGGNDRYAKQMLFEYYSRLPSTIRTRMIEPVVGATARITTKFPVGKASRYIEQANVPLPDRLQSYNFLHRHAPTTVFSADFLAEVDETLLLQQLRDEYAVPRTRSCVNRMLFLDWKFTLHDNDLVKVNSMCHLAGVAVAYPMLNQRVVDLSLRLPGDWKVRNGQLRWFYKRAMRNFLPQEIIGKTKHGFGLPFGNWTRTHVGLRRLSEDALEALGRRGYFRREFLSQALELHREGHASYYGELVWILMVLELWLQASGH